MQLHYDAFISYRHAPLDIRIASEVQRRLERYPVPREIQKQTGKRKIERVFRDKEELPITSDLNDEIGGALKNSDFLIVICSTNTASSAWVRREIETFLQTHDRRHVLTVLADGEPEAVIPDLLRYEEISVRESDGTEHTVKKEIEPLSCDYRLPLRRARREELPRLAAAILGCAYDELRQRQRRHRFRQTVAAFTAALVLISGVAAYAVNRAYVIARQAERIEEEYRNTLITQSRYLAEKSGELLAGGDRMGALQVALAALPESETDDTRPLVTEALFALNNAVYPYHIAQPDAFLAKCTLTTDGCRDMFGSLEGQHALSPSGTRWMTADSSGQIYIFDLSTDARVAALSPQSVFPEKTDDAFLSADFLTDDRIVLYLSSCAVCWDLNTERAVWTAPYGEDDASKGPFYSGVSLYDMAHQAVLAVLWTDSEFLLCRFDAATGERLTSISETLPEHGFVSLYGTLALSPSGDRAAVGFADDAIRRDSSEPVPAMLTLIDLSDGDCRTVSVQNGDVVGLAFLSEDRLCALSTDFGWADSTDNIFSYAVEEFSFPDGTAQTRTTGEAFAHREMGDESYPSRGVQLWHRELADGTAEDLVLVRLAGRMLILSQEDGTVLRSVDFSDDVLCVDAYSAGQLFLALRSGQLMVYIPTSSSFSEMGSVSTTVQNAVYSKETGEFLLSLENSQNIVVMSNQLEDPGVAEVELNSIDGIDYAFGDGWEYRIVRETMADDETALFDGTVSPDRLLFYRPLESTPFAETDAEGQIGDFCVQHAEDGGDVCWYLLETEQGRTLCGWDLAENQKAFDFALDEPVRTLYGLWNGRIVLQSSSALRLLNPKDGSEKTISLENNIDVHAFCPDDRVLALLGRDGLQLLNLEQWAWVELPAALAELRTDSTNTGHLAFSPDGKHLAVWANGEAQIISTDSLAVEQKINIPCRSGGEGLFLNDRILLVCGDSGRLAAWDLETQSVVMEDAYSVPGLRSLTLGDGCFRTEDSGGTGLYTYTEDGRFARELYVNRAYISPTGSEILSLRNAYGAGNTSIFISDTAFRVYPLYTLDELVQAGKEILGGKTLTEAERIRYFINN